MPRFIIHPQAPSPKHERLVQKLVQEFKASSTNLQPLILEEQVPSTKSRHVRVIWDAWKDLTNEQRSSVIVDAYRQAEGPGAADEITIAEGVTPPEALALGLLPFKVVPTPRRDGAAHPTEPQPPKVKPGQIAQRRVLAEEARRTLLGPRAKELRYARLEDAESARQRLEQALPGSSWAVVQEAAVES
jgi:hypothetical protein